MKLDIVSVGYGSGGQAAAGFLLQPSGLQVLWKLGLLDGALAHGAKVRWLFGDTPLRRAVRAA